MESFTVTISSQLNGIITSVIMKDLPVKLSKIMADRYVLTHSKKPLNNSVQKLSLKDDMKQINCTNLIYDGKRFKWTSSWERLKYFVDLLTITY